MEQRYLGASGFQVPLISLGTATFGGGDAFFRAWGTTEVAEARRLVDICLEAGVNLFDTADVYSQGLSEEILGQAITHCKARVLISSKASFRMGDGPNQIGSSRHHLIESCEGSLRRLGVDHIDLWQLHGFDARTPLEETLATLDGLVRAGKVRYIGCSNFSGWQLMKSLAVSERHGWSRHVAHQACYSLLAREFEWELMPLGMDQGVGTVVWSPLAGGKLSGKVGRQRAAPPGSRMVVQEGMGPFVPQERLFAITDCLERTARECSCTVAQVALAWVMGRPTVSTVVIGARNEDQLRENLGALAVHLTREQVALLDAASELPAIYPYWHQRATLGARNGSPLRPPQP